MNKSVKKVNNADMIWAFLNRINLPAHIIETATPGNNWYIFTQEKGVYLFKEVRYRDFNDFRIEDLPAPVPYVDPLRKIHPCLFNHSTEQTFLSRVEQSGVLDDLVGVPLLKVDNHRKRNASLGSIEIDGVMAEETPRGRKPVVALIEVKGIDEKISYEQVVHHYRLAHEEYGPMDPCSIAIQLITKNTARVLKFSFESTYECDVAQEWYITFDGDYPDDLFQQPAVHRVH
ncbi:hypothetical protein Salmuc_03315 [Salipiger mucosus DSM 16094]|uniref:Endonuclease n=1 Tax=Salipiger mucosus DSM 16094 TaxID=1123237 RepID=S9QEJ6_9RHOB|nr:hypothetical protein Salmuc_03315 [Salipiger mucosus DSM 16094]